MVPVAVAPPLSPQGVSEYFGTSNVWPWLVQHLLSIGGDRQSAAACRGRDRRYRDCFASIGRVISRHVEGGFRGIFDNGVRIRYSIGGGLAGPTVIDTVPVAVPPRPSLSV